MINNITINYEDGTSSVYVLEKVTAPVPIITVPLNTPVQIVAQA